MRKPDHRLTRGDDLSRLAKRFDDRSIRVRYKNGVSGLVPSDARVGFSGRELRCRRVRCGFRQLVALLRDRAVVQQVAVSPLVGGRLNGRCSRRNHGVAFRSERKAKVGVVDPHQRLAGLDLLPDTYKPFHNFSGDAEAEIALDLRAYDAREASL